MKKTEKNKATMKNIEAIISEIRNSWRKKYRVSTLPVWAQVQNKIIQQCKESLPDIDDDTKKKITRDLLLTLRCHSCERARSNSCNFSVCIRGLLSGNGGGK